MERMSERNRVQLCVWVCVSLKRVYTSVRKGAKNCRLGRSLLIRVLFPSAGSCTHHALAALLQHHGNTESKGSRTLRTIQRSLSRVDCIVQKSVGDCFMDNWWRFYFQRRLIVYWCEARTSPVLNFFSIFSLVLSSRKMISRHSPLFSDEQIA